MSRSSFIIATFCASLAIISLIIVSGCTTTPTGPGGTVPVTATPTPIISSVPFPTTNPEQPSGIQLKGNVYGLSSNPLTGIDTIFFTIKPSSREAPIDLTRMDIVFSTTDTAPVVLTRSTSDTTRTFTTTMGNNDVTALNPGDEVEITFRVKVVPGGTGVNIQLRPSVGPALTISRIVPAVISSTTVLN